MSSKKPGPPSTDFFVKYLDDKFSTMDEALKEVRQNQETASDNITKIKTVLVKQQQQLTYHIRRTDILEKDLKPIKKRYDFTLRLVGVISLSVTIIAGIAQIVSWLISLRPGP